MPSPDDSPCFPGDDDKNALRDRIDTNPPYGSNFPEKVARFREFLAGLIARQILAERQDSKTSDHKTDS